MDRRRFEAAHLMYACLQMVDRYPDAISSHLKFESDVNDTLNEITPALFRHFESRYAGMFLTNMYVLLIMACASVFPSVSLIKEYIHVVPYRRKLLLVQNFTESRVNPPPPPE